MNQIIQTVRHTAYSRRSTALVLSMVLSAGVLATTTAMAATAPVTAATTVANDPAASAGLSARLKALISLQADFTQTTQSATTAKAGHTGIVSTPNTIMSAHGDGAALAKVVVGTLSVQKPGLFRWEVREPYQQLIVSNGKDVRTFDADLQQMTIKPMTGEWTQTPALLFGGDVARLEKEFVISQKAVGAVTEYTLLPKAKDALFASVKLQFKGNEPYSMDLQDSLGQKTRIAFFKTRLNTRLPEAQFNLTPPAGTDVIRE